MVATFEIEDGIMQMTSENMIESVRNRQPLWIVFSAGTQCIAGMPGGSTKHLDISHLLDHYQMKDYKGYVAQPPWVLGILNDLPDIGD